MRVAWGNPASSTVSAREGTAVAARKTWKDAPMELDPPHHGLASSPGSDAARIAMTDASVLALLRQHFAGTDAMVLCPGIPGKKELAARAVHAQHLPSDERVLALFDDTVFGSGDEGFVVTARRLCWKNPRGRAQMIEWRHLDPDRMYADRQRLFLGGAAIELGGDESVAGACEAAFHVLAFSARVVVPAAPAAAARSGVVLGARAHGDARDESSASDHPTYRPSSPPHAPNATPPPPHAVTYDSYVVHASSQKGPSFACWHCRTPLHWNTPQCARCSAWPTPQGWQRTG